MEISAFDDLVEKLAVTLTANQQKLKWSKEIIDSLLHQNNQMSLRIRNLESENKLLNELYVIRIGRGDR